MAMSVQRQSDQYNLDAPLPASRVAQVEIEDMLKSGRRIQANTLNYRQAAPGDLYADSTPRDREDDTWASSRDRGDAEHEEQDLEEGLHDYHEGH